MDTNNEELRTPPLALIALLGRTDLHPGTSDFLKDQRPPLATIGVSDVASATHLFRKAREQSSEEQLLAIKGILRREWLAKHRKQRPAVTVWFFDSESLMSDPTSYAHVCQQLDALRSATKVSGAKLVILVVQNTPQSAELSEERADSLRRRAEIDKRCLLTYTAWDAGASLRKLGQLVNELAVAFYRDEGRRVKGRGRWRHAQLKLNQRSAHPELAIRYAFKIAAYAEFRQDWAAAIKYYRSAYSSLQDLPLAKDARRFQHIAQATAVAEQIHFKLCTILLHSGSVAEAVSQLSHHMHLWKRVLPPGAPPIVHAAHTMWCSRQYRAFAELLAARAPTTGQSWSSQREQSSGFYFHAAASAMIDCRCRYEQAQESSDGAEGRGATLLPGAFTGQWVGAGHLVGDNEWRAHLMLEQAGVSHARIATELLTRAHDQFKQQQAPSSSSTCNRLFAHLIAQMAGEYMRLLDYTNARRLLVSMASVYRREGWEQLLCAALQSLRECARRLGLHREHAENSLELSALRLSMDIEQRMALFASALAVLTEPLPASPPPASGAKDQTLQLGYLIHETSPLRTVLSCMGCFHTAEVSCGTSCTFTVALQARVPLDVPIWKLEVHFNHQEFDTSRGRSSWGGANQEPAVLMTPYTWVYVHFPITSSTPTTLECIGVVAHVGPAAFFKWEFDHAKSPPKPPPLASLAPSLADRGPWAVKWLDSTPSRTLKVEQALPAAALNLDCSAPALVGELFPVIMTVHAKDASITTSFLRVSLEPSAARNSKADESTSPAVSFVDAGVATTGPSTNLGETVELVLPPIDKRATHTTTVYVQFQKVSADVRLVASLHFGVPSSESTQDDPLLATATLMVSCDSPFTLECQYKTWFRRHVLSLSPADTTGSMSALPVPVLPLNEPILLTVTMDCTAGVPLLTKPLHLELKPSGPFSLRSSSMEAAPTGGDTLLLPSSTISEVFELRPSAAQQGTVFPADTPTVLGSIRASWQRLQNPQKPAVRWVHQDLQLAEIVKMPPLTVHTHCPEIGKLGVPFTLTLVIENHTTSLQEVHVSVVDAVGFVLAGQRSGALGVLPHACATLNYSLVAISTGMQHMPGIHVTVSQSATLLTIPDHARRIFIHPSDPLPPRKVLSQ